MADFVLRGCPYPLVPTPHGYMPTQTGVNQIKSDLLCLLMTNPKERVMHPEFGTPLRSLAFEPADQMLERKAKSMIVAAIQKWEPRIAFKEITTVLNDDDNSLLIRLVFQDPNNLQQFEVLELELPLGQGA